MLELSELELLVALSSHMGAGNLSPLEEQLTKHKNNSLQTTHVYM